jgi:hypothetical protein
LEFCFAENKNTLLEKKSAQSTLKLEEKSVSMMSGDARGPAQNRRAPGPAAFNGLAGGSTTTRKPVKLSNVATKAETVDTLHHKAPTVSTNLIFFAPEYTIEICATGHACQVSHVTLKDRTKNKEGRNMWKKK